MAEVWSNDQEFFNEGGIEEAVENIGYPVAVGETVAVWKGTAQPFKAADFIKVEIDQAIDAAIDVAGESVDGWPQADENQISELHQTVWDAVNVWADRHGLQPTFYTVWDVEEIKLEILDENRAFRVVDPSSEKRDTGNE